MIIPFRANRVVVIENSLVSVLLEKPSFVDRTTTRDVNDYDSPSSLTW